MTSQLVFFHVFSFRIVIILPEAALNVMGTLWIFCGFVQCDNVSDSFANMVVEGERREIL